MLAIPRSPDARARMTCAPVALPALLSITFGLLLAGCSGSGDMTAPTSAFQTESPFSGGNSGPSAREGMAGGLSDYPLAIGNRWDYVLASRVETFPTDGAPSASNETGRWRAEVIDRVQAYGREYFSVQEGDPGAGLGVVYYQRVDADGLFEYDNPPVFSPSSSGGIDPLAVTRRALEAHRRSLAGSPHAVELAAAASRVTEKLASMQQLFAAGAIATTEPPTNELALLRFPIHAGASWTVRSSPFFGRVVIGQDEMMLPAGRVRAWRVQGISELFGADDRVYFWYGRAGLVRLHLHVVVDATDAYGNPIGKAIGEFDQSLAQVRLNGDPGAGK